MSKARTFLNGMCIIGCALIGGLIMGHYMNAFAAHPSMAGHQKPMLLQDVARYIVAVGAAVTLVGGGWAAYAHVQFRKISALFIKLDGLTKKVDTDSKTFLEKYNADKLAEVQAYATKAEVKEAIKDIQDHIDTKHKENMDGQKDIRTSLEDLRKSIGTHGG